HRPLMRSVLVDDSSTRRRGMSLAGASSYRLTCHLGVTFMAWNVRDLYRPRRTVRRRPLRRAELQLEHLEQRLAPANVTVFGNSNSGGTTGVNSNEVVLTPATVNTNNFGKLSTTNLDGQVYAQPLIMQGVVIGPQGSDSNVNIVGGASGSHSVVYVATQ